MTYTQLQDRFWREDKAERIAEDLGVRPAEAAGWIAQLWAAACIKAQHGDLSSFWPREIAKFCRADVGPGAPDPVALVEALERHCVIERDEDDELRIHDWKLPDNVREAARKRDKRAEERAKRRPRTSTSRPLGA